MLHSAYLEHRDDPLALYLQLTERPTFEVGRDQVPNVSRYRDAPGLSLGHHARGDVDRIAPDVELIPFLSHDPGDDRPGVNAGPDRPSQVGVDQGRGHL